MATNAQKKFNKTIKRAEELLRVYLRIKNLELGRRKKKMRLPKDLIRSSVVLSVSALDAYVTSAFSEKFVPYIKQNTPDEPLIKMLYDAGLDTREALELVKMQRPYRRIRTLIERYYDRYTTQRFEVIDKLFAHYRLQNISDNAQRKAGRATLKRSVELLIERRHKIAHEGDYNSHGRLNPISRSEIKRRIDDLKLLVSNMDDIICNRV